MMGGMSARPDRNVLGGALEACSMSPRTGFLPRRLLQHRARRRRAARRMLPRHGRVPALREGPGQRPGHAGAAIPVSGLKPGDQWCVCAATWRQAYEAGVAPPVVLAATHEETLAVVPLSALRELAVDAGTNH
jgi:uncharacterized protein (DUF2237 family)